MIYITKGEAKAIPIQIKNDSGGVVDLTGLSIEFIAKEDASSSTAQIQRLNTAAGGGDTQIKVMSASLGLCVVYLTSANTAGLTQDALYHCYIKAGNYVNELKVRTSKGEIATASTVTTNNAGVYSVIYCEYGETPEVLDYNELSVTGSFSSGTLTLVSSGFVEGKTDVRISFDNYGWNFNGDDIEIYFDDQWVSGAKATVIISVYS